MLLSELLALHERCHGPNRLFDSIGDGYLYLHDPFFRRVRDAALARGFRYSLDDPQHYFGFPLVHLDTILESRTIPYRPTLPALRHLEDTRPGFFELGDFKKNRPAPNYLLHESAHAVAFEVLFGRPESVRRALSEDGAVVRALLGEAYAMTAEYFSACAVSGGLHAWFFSVSSYRHRTPGKKAIGELLTELGFPFVARAVLLAFLVNNFLVDRLDRRRFETLAALAGAPRLDAHMSHKLRSALNSLMVMNPEFRLDTARLFLAMFGRSRDVRRELRMDPLGALTAEPRLRDAVDELVHVLFRDNRGDLRRPRVAAIGITPQS